MPSSYTGLGWTVGFATETAIITFGPDIAHKGGIWTCYSDLMNATNTPNPVGYGLAPANAFIKGDEPWYIAGRFGVDHQVGDKAAFIEEYIGAIEDSDATDPDPSKDSVKAGYIGTVSTAFFSAQLKNGLNTTNLISPVAVDLGVFHNFELWYDGANANLRIDSGVITSAAAGAGLPDAILTPAWINYFFGTDPTNVALGSAIDKYLVLTGVPTAFSQGVPP